MKLIKSLKIIYIFKILSDNINRTKEHSINIEVHIDFKATRERGLVNEC